MATAYSLYANHISQKSFRFVMQAPTRTVMRTGRIISQDRNYENGINGIVGKELKFHKLMQHVNII